MDQSRVVTIVLCASAAAVAWDGIAKLVPHPQTADVEIGTTLVLPGRPRPSGYPGRIRAVGRRGDRLGARLAQSGAVLHESRLAARELDAAFRHRYGHLISIEPRHSEPAV